MRKRWLLFDNLGETPYTTKMIDLLKFATESIANYISTLIMLLGLAGLVTGVINAIIKQLTTSIVGIIIAAKAKVDTTFKADE